MPVFASLQLAAVSLFMEYARGWQTMPAGHAWGCCLCVSKVGVMGVLIDSRGISGGFCAVRA